MLSYLSLRRIRFDYRNPSESQLFDHQSQAFDRPESGTADIFLARLPEVDYRATGAWNLLTDDEASRAERFIVEPPRRSYVWARAGLRSLLSAYLNLAPSEIQFSYNGFGKPRLKIHGEPLQFNQSHSGDWVAYAFAASDLIGVDVESLARERKSNWRTVAERALDDDQLASLPRLTETEGRDLFLRQWTLREACMKAEGRGFVGAPDLPDLIINGEHRDLQRAFPCYHCCPNATYRCASQFVEERTWMSVAALLTE